MVPGFQFVRQKSPLAPYRGSVFPVSDDVAAVVRDLQTTCAGARFFVLYVECLSGASSRFLQRSDAAARHTPAATILGLVAGRDYQIQLHGRAHHLESKVAN